MWCLPGAPSAEFVCAMEDVLEVYQRPYDPAHPQVCVDETSKQLTQEVRVPLPVKPGQVQIYDHEYRRNGVANLFMVVEPLSGTCRVKVTDQHTRADWAVLMRELVDVQYPEAETIVLVTDNLNTHDKASLYEAFAPQEAKRIADKLEIHHTPKHGSWLDMAEMQLSILSRQCLDRRIPDRESLEREVAAWSRDHQSKPLAWRFTMNDARIKLRKLYPSIQA
jgi:DDE superfamily endonuclease